MATQLQALMLLQPSPSHELARQSGARDSPHDLSSSLEASSTEHGSFDALGARSFDNSRPSSMTGWAFRCTAPLSALTRYRTYMHVTSANAMKCGVKSLWHACTINLKTNDHDCYSAYFR